MTVTSVLFFFLGALCACVTYEAVPVTEIATEIVPGDRVIVTSYAGDELSFKVQAIDLVGRAVVGEDVRMPFDDVALIERKRYWWGRTAGVFSGTLLVVGLLLLAITAALAGALAA